MAGTITAREFDLIRDFIEKETAISLAEDKVYLVETRLSRIMVKQGIADYFGLHQALLDPHRKALRDEVIDAMTTNETLWFRDSAPFDAFRDYLLPAYANEIREGKRDKVRIWSAASSTGQEAYSLAMIFRDAARSNSALNMDQLEILGTDLSDTALDTARKGVYAGIAMDRGLPPDFRQRYFVPRGDSYEISDEIRKRVVFRKFNLQNSFITVGSFDVILTRYVLIYFQDDFKREVLRKAHGALEKSGVLFLGSAESLPDDTPGYSLVQNGRATWYQKVEKDRPGPGISNIQPAKPLTSTPPTDSTEIPTRPASGPVPTVSTNNDTDNLDEATSNLSETMRRLKELNDKHSAGK